MTMQAPSMNMPSACHPSQKGAKRQSMELPIWARNRSGHRYSMQNTVLSAQANVKVHEASQKSGTGWSEGDKRAPQVCAKTVGGPRTSRPSHRKTRSSEVNDITGFWSTRVSDQKRSLGIRDSTQAERATREPTQIERNGAVSTNINSSPSEFSRSKAEATSKPGTAPDRPATAPAGLPSTSSSVKPTLKRKATIPPPTPPKDWRPKSTDNKKIAVQTGPRANKPKVHKVHDSAPRTSTIPPSRSVPTLSSSPLVPFPTNQVTPKGSLPTLQPPPRLPKDETSPRSPKRFLPISLSMFVPSRVRKLSAPTLPFSRDAPKSVQPPTGQADMSEQKKIDLETRRRTGLDHIVIAVGHENHTYSQHAQASDVLVVLEHLRKLRKT